MVPKPPPPQAVCVSKKAQPLRVILSIFFLLNKNCRIYLDNCLQEIV